MQTMAMLAARSRLARIQQILGLSPALSPKHFLLKFETTYWRNLFPCQAERFRRCATSNDPGQGSLSILIIPRREAAPTRDPQNYRVTGLMRERVAG